MTTSPATLLPNLLPHQKCTDNSPQSLSVSSKRFLPAVNNFSESILDPVLPLSILLRAFVFQKCSPKASAYIQALLSDADPKTMSKVFLSSQSVCVLAASLSPRFPNNFPLTQSHSTICLSVFWSVGLLVCEFVGLSVCLSIGLSVYRSICLSVGLSVCHRFLVQCPLVRSPAGVGGYIYIYK